jgi:ABC-type cobalamin/Fe3+-siderophores transport system ATPase subunit
VRHGVSVAREINARGITMFLVEQNVHQTLAVSSYGYVLSKGRVVAEGVPQELAGRAEVRDAYFAGARSIFPKRGCHPHQVRGRLCRDHALGALWMIVHMCIKHVSSQRHC